MERSKHRRSSDESAMAKAAAWAWYRRGSGFETKLGSEFDVTRVRQNPSPKPSRYKLEAIRTVREVTGSRTKNSSPLLSPNHTDGSDLLDSYEIERISRQLDFYILASNLEDRGMLLGGDGGRRRIVPSSESEAVVKKKSNKTKSKGFLTRYGLTCGSSNDVVEFGKRGLPEKQVVVVVSAGSCRPRAAGV